MGGLQRVPLADEGQKLPLRCFVEGVHRFESRSLVKLLSRVRFPDTGANLNQLSPSGSGSGQLGPSCQGSGRCDGSELTEPVPWPMNRCLDSLSAVPALAAAVRTYKNVLEYQQLSSNKGVVFSMCLHQSEGDMTGLLAVVHSELEAIFRDASMLPCCHQAAVFNRLAEVFTNTTFFICRLPRSRIKLGPELTLINSLGSLWCCLSS